MLRRCYLALLTGVVGLSWLAGAAAPARADGIGPRFYHYPYYYFPHNYWPTNGPRWPEPPGAPYEPPPAYMSYPPFLEPAWHYENFEPQRYYRGFHWWLDQF